MGRSARVPFAVKAKREDTEARVTAAESFFIDSLEEWREKMGLEKMTLVGHSLGAYLSVAYALKHPARVDKLILLSPAGVPHGPNTTEPARELSDDRDEMIHINADGNSVHGVETMSRERVEEIHEEQRMASNEVSIWQRLLVHLWEEGWSPFQVVRSLSMFGPMLVGKVSCTTRTTSISYSDTLLAQYSSRRFSGLSEEETRDIHDYILNITLAKGSGEYCICK